MAQVLREIGELPKVKSTGDLTIGTVARYVNSKRDQNPNTVLGLLSYLRAACGIAKGSGWIKVNPFDVRKDWIRGCKKKKKRHHSLIEIERVFSHLEQDLSTWQGHRLYALFATVAYTGLRRGEALHLQTHDIDHDEGVLWLVPGRKLRFKTKEGDEDDTPVACPDVLLEVLKSWQKRNGSIWLFPGLRGTSPWTGGMPGKKPLDELKAAGKDCGIDGLTFQSLRHSWATHAESAWCLPGAVIQRNLRHTTERTSREHYRHADLANLRGWVRGISFGGCIGRINWGGQSNGTEAPDGQRQGDFQGAGTDARPGPIRQANPGAFEAPIAGASRAG
jgi:integrase